MSQKVKPGKEILTLSEAEKKALEKLDHTNLLIEIQNLRNRIEVFQSEVYDLNQKIRTMVEENLALTLKMENDIIQANDHIQILQSEYDHFRQNSEEKFSSIVEEKDKTIKAMIELQSKEIKDKDTKIDALYQQVQKLIHFEEREEEYQKKILDLEQRYKQQEYGHNDQMKKMEKIYFKQNQNLESVNKAKTDDIMRNADKIAEKKVKDSEELTKRENKKLRQELELHQKELESIKKERAQIADENKNFRRNQSINQDGAVEYQNISHQQNSRIKILKEKVNYLKNYIADEIQKYTKEIELMKYQNQTKLSEYEYQIRNLKEQLQIRTKELKNIRTVSQMILNQRSDIEQFFLEALDQVKQEINKKIKQEKQAKLPDIYQKSIISIQSANQEEQKSKSINEKVFLKNTNKYQIDLNDLELEDKEKLLRILFSKMNQGMSPHNWKQLPEKSLIEINSSLKENNLQVNQQII